MNILDTGFYEITSSLNGNRKDAQNVFESGEKWTNEKVGQNIRFQSFQMAQPNERFSRKTFKA